MTGVRSLDKKTKHNFIQGIFFVLLVSLTIYILLQSPIFDVRKIEIVGRKNLAKEELVSLSGVSLGSNIFKQNLHIGEEKISLLPLVKDARINRKFPSTVVITVTERKAAALLPYKKGFIEVDREGVYLQKGELNSLSLPIITGVVIGELHPGQRVKAEKTFTALEVINKLPPELPNRLSEVHVDNENKVNIYTIDGIQGRLGLPENINKKGKLFLQVLTQINEEEIIYIDITSDKPVIKYATMPGEAT
ncbi:MAG: FtsQ-type POTRA domain-containing protein [Firmicutes bacterium]|nr:FtsQ-type POTRA domain-containing protein [Bacillota bacterium]